MQVTMQTWCLATRHSQPFTAEVAADFVTRHFCKTFPTVWLCPDCFCSIRGQHLCGVCVNVSRCSLVIYQLPSTSQIVTDTSYGLKSTEKVFEICSGATPPLAYILSDFALLCGTCAYFHTRYHHPIRLYWHLRQ